MARPKNTKKTPEQYREQYKEVIPLILANYSTNAIHAMTNASLATIKRLKKMVREEKI